MTNPTKLELTADPKLSTIKETLEQLAGALDVDKDAPEFEAVLNRLTEYTAGQLGVSMFEVKPRRAKLTWDKVDDIRTQYAGKDMTMTELAEKHGVTYSTVSRIVTNKMWIKK